MSYVATIPKISGVIIGDVWSYALNFWAYLDGEPRKQFQNPFRTDLDVESYYQQKMDLFNSWWLSKQGLSSVFFRRWDYWAFGSRSNQQQVAEDWVPPGEFAIPRLESIALPQSPDRRQRILMPDGTYRRIRTGSEKKFQ
jgi:hypothetical protein